MGVSAASSSFILNKWFRLLSEAACALLLYILEFVYRATFAMREIKSSSAIGFADTDFAAHN